MNCDFDYCIYNEDSRCNLDDVSINSLGMCDDCIIVTISKADLVTLKKKHFRASAKQPPRS